MSTSTPVPNTPVLILGTGAMACLFAARLSAAGAVVTMLGTWPKGLAALRARGVRLVELDGNQNTYPVRATADPADCAGASLAFVLVKSWQTERAARQLAECLAPDGVAVTLQNGMGNREALARFLGDRCIVGGITTNGSTLLEPGVVRAAGNGTVTLEMPPCHSPLVHLLGAAGFIVDIVPDVHTLLWGKLVINAAINPLTALLRVTNGELLERPSVRPLMAEAAREAAAVAAACGVQLPYPDPVAAVEAVARRTAQNRSSMLQDVLRGAPTEIDAINGAVVRAGEAAGVDTPVNRRLWLLVKGIISNADPLDALADRSSQSMRASLTERELDWKSLSEELPLQPLDRVLHEA